MNLTSYSEQLTRYPELGFWLDLSNLPLGAEFLSAMEPKIARAFADMKALESGAIANPDENRMVGHYWLRNSCLAPSPKLKADIDEPLEDLLQFAAEIHAGTVSSPSGKPFDHVLLIGIGGSALGPQLVAEALGSNAKIGIDFFDNTDPEGMDKTLAKLAQKLGTTLVVVISKSGGTPETRNGMLEAEAAWKSAGLDFAKQAVAVTGIDSKLDKYATENGWIKRFPMDDWIGGRTSVMSVVGLLPAALQGIDVKEFLHGASEMDQKTRQTETPANAAMRLALAWFKAGNGRGEKDMVVLPYKDSLVLFSKYLQQLIMESLGKELDLDGKKVNQGIAVYGNKGSTDQHAYIQQLRDGVANFFATFIEVRKARRKPSFQVEPGITSGDYLQGFLRGTRKALSESGRASATISIQEVTPKTLGNLIALFERAVSFYASLTNVNAYHQPGVEAGKKAAGVFLELLSKVRTSLGTTSATAEQIAQNLSADAQDVYHCLVHIAENDNGVSWTQGKTAAEDSFSKS